MNGLGTKNPSRRPQSGRDAVPTVRPETAKVAEDIAVERVTKTYQTRRGEPIQALSDVDLRVAQHEFVTILGPSGCGKSTLLKMLAGLVAPSSGSIAIGGRPLAGPRTDIGFVFQSSVLLPWKTVLDNVLVPVTVQRLPRRWGVERATELLALVGLDDFRGNYPQELSGGMQQRVNIARALVHDPSVLLMDEPFGALDALTREHMAVELLRIWQQFRKTVLFVTHSISEAVLLADRVVVMTQRPGKIAGCLEIQIERPRSLDITTSEPFGKYVQEARALLTAETG